MRVRVWLDVHVFVDKEKHSKILLQHRCITSMLVLLLLICTLGHLHLFVMLLLAIVAAFACVVALCQAFPTLH